MKMKIVMKQTTFKNISFPMVESKNNNQNNQFFFNTINNQNNNKINNDGLDKNFIYSGNLFKKQSKSFDENNYKLDKKETPIMFDYDIPSKEFLFNPSAFIKNSSDFIK